ncbi:ECF transporter S component [Lactobacillus hamsteri]|uniref:Integral membrane protein n=1 Tax=Lactobacillus hamsteri DSM 5661 = JCM 6256 TaxID=1423754 RepID=A0A0R1YFN6_9LACO|nr:ECF transporter S component [Lactobacillus hamsteri]KRM41294.1 integral membrane protein [Lactobacillus hamsteri DSM 5661 = JCM 6256]
MRKKETTRLTITAIFAAILILQTFVPNIGYVRILPTLPAITTIPLTIAIYGSLMGPKSGLLFGLFWGITRLIVAYTQPGDMVSLMLFQNPIISLVPSIVAGWLPGLIGKYMHQEEIGYILSGAVTSLANTFLVIGLTSLLFMNNAASLIKYLGNTTGSNSLFIVLIVALGINGVVESVFTAVLTPIIVLPLKKVLKRIMI